MALTLTRCCFQAECLRRPTARARLHPAFFHRLRPGGTEHYARTHPCTHPCTHTRTPARTHAQHSAQPAFYSPPAVAVPRWLSLPAELYKPVYPPQDIIFDNNTRLVGFWTGIMFWVTFFVGCAREVTWGAAGHANQCLPAPPLRPHGPLNCQRHCQHVDGFASAKLNSPRRLCLRAMSDLRRRPRALPLHGNHRPGALGDDWWQPSLSSTRVD